MQITCRLFEQFCDDDVVDYTVSYILFYISGKAIIILKNAVPNAMKGRYRKISASIIISPITIKPTIKINIRTTGEHEYD